MCFIFKLNKVLYETSNSCFSWIWPVLAVKFHTRQKSFLTQSKLDILIKEKRFWKLMISLCYFQKKKKCKLDFGCGPFWPCFYLNRVLKNQVLPIFFRTTAFWHKCFPFLHKILQKSFDGCLQCFTNYFQ